MLYLFATATELGATKADQWVGQRVVELIEVGSPKFIGHLQSIGPPDTTATTARVWTKLLHYLGENRDRVGTENDWSKTRRVSETVK